MLDISLVLCTNLPWLQYIYLFTILWWMSSWYRNGTYMDVLYVRDLRYERVKETHFCEYSISRFWRIFIFWFYSFQTSKMLFTISDRFHNVTEIDCFQFRSYSIFTSNTFVWIFLFIVRSLIIIISITFALMLNLNL